MPINPLLITTSLFSISVSLFLLCSFLLFLDFTYRWYCTIIVFLCLTYFAKHDTLKVHPCCCKWKNCILSYGWVVFLCVCVYIYVCGICMYIYVCIHTYMYTYMYVHICIHVHTYLYVYACTCICMWICMHVCAHICMYTYMHACRRTYMYLCGICMNIYACIHTHIFMYACACIYVCVCVCMWRERAHWRNNYLQFSSDFLYKVWVMLRSMTLKTIFIFFLS